MALTKDISLESAEQKEFDLVPEGMYQVQLLDIEDKESETWKSKHGETEGKEYEVKLDFTFGILTEGEQRERKVWANFVKPRFRDHKGAKDSLSKISEALRGEAITPEDEVTLTEKGLNDFLMGLVGKQCRIVVEHGVGKSSGKQFAFPANFLAAEEQLTPLEIVNVDDISF